MSAAGATGPERAQRRALLLSLLAIRVWIAERFRPSELQLTLVWAGLVGFCSAVASVLFRVLTDAVHWLLTQHSGSLVESFELLPWWQRLATPAVGGALAGLTILYGVRFTGNKSSTDYMEAIVLRDGTVPFRSSLVKSLSALFTIASGGSIGREGPLVQLASMVASLVGRFRKWPTPRRRLIVACGAAAGIASAYNAPIAGSLFVAEIVLGSVAMETFGPLVFSSVIATLTVRGLLNGNPLYAVPPFRLNSNWEIFPYLALGLVAGIAAPWFLKFLRECERFFSRTKLPIVPRLALGGLVVGALSIVHPEVCGNGYTAVSSILHGNWLWQSLVAIFILKIVATGATFGSGAVGGVFTPTLFVGASLGYLFGCGVHSVWLNPALDPSAFALVGMGAFLAATTHAPLMAILMLFEVTLDYQIILPLMLGCVIAYYTSVSIEKRSIYSESLARKGARAFDEQLAHLHVPDLMKADPPTVLTTARFDEIAQTFITHRFNFLYVVDDQRRFRGAVSLHDVKPYLADPHMADFVIAADILRENFPTITPRTSLAEALECFARFDGERLPVVDAETAALLGRVSKSDVILAIAERSKEPVTNK
ncbi:MAG: chloride channel protein family [Chthoniobacter sp.]|jgi:CIC family chloride channel protein|nr:chloride channel protein family [Chthoniobacter sp.]